MDLTALEEKIVRLEKKLLDAELRAARLETAQQIQNLLGRYANYHSAGMWKEQEDCFALKTPGVRAIFNGNVYEGEKGIRNHYTGLLAAAEKDLTGRLYAHELLTPIIEVAGDNQSAKAFYSSLGFETLVMEDGTKKSLWSYCKFKFGFIKEDGQWKIYRMDMHGTFNTPFDGKGWAEEPYLIGFSSNEVNNWDPRWAPNRLVKENYVPLQTDSPDCDIHNLIPAPPEPYDTWDEGWE